MLGPGWADGGTMVARRAGLAYGSGWMLRVRASVLAGRGCRHGHVAVSARLRRRWRKNSTQPARSLPPEEASMLDVVIVGGGPAGLSAALILGRARRNVLLCDSGQPRNAGVHAMHGFLSRDGTDPAALRQTGRDQLRAYPTVQMRATDGTTEQARRLLLATGVADQLPPIPGLAQLWGRGVFNCPYCDGWEVRDQPLAVLASDLRNFQLALQLTRWSPDVLLASNGPAGLDDDARRLLAAHSVQLREEPIARLDGGDGRLGRIVLATGEPVARAAAFLHAPTRQRSDLPRQLGCTLLEDDSVMVDDLGQTSVPGVFAVGDMARRPSMPVPGAQVIIAAAEGAIAAVAIDQMLLLQQLAP